MLKRLLSLGLMAFCSVTVANGEQPELPIKPPFVTDASVTGRYYFAHEHLVRDAYITTPIEGKFYFKIFTGQTPTHAHMTVQYYNEIDGVATFNAQGIAVFSSPHKDCDLYFVFKPPKLVIEQEKNCGMAPEFGMEARGVYTQLESY